MAKSNVRQQADVAATLQARQNTHGDYALTAEIIQQLKQDMRVGNWDSLTVVQKESLEMIAHKIGRILSGNPDHADHWHDIAGYATLAEKQLG